MGIASTPPFDFNTPLPTPLQQETSGPVNTLREGMGIIPQGTMLPFEKMNEHTFLHYQANSNNPMLESPLGMVRTAGSDIAEDMGWMALKNGILESLPPDIQAGLEALHEARKKGLSFENEDAWSALDALIDFAARSEYFIVSASRLSRTENAQNEAVLNSQLPGIITSNMAEEAEKLANMVKEDLKTRLNDPEYDACCYLIHQYETLVQELAKESVT